MTKWLAPRVDCAEMRRRAALLSIPLLFALACDSGEPPPTPAKQDADDKDQADKDRGASPEAAKPEAAQPEAPKVEAGMSAKQVLAAWGHPDTELPPSEGLACFEYEAGPKKVVCFRLLTESASWAQVLGENYEVNEVRDPTPADAEGATQIVKPVIPEPDSAEPMH